MILIGQDSASPPYISAAQSMMQQAADYWIDAWQRSILFLDVLRHRGNDHFAYATRKAPNVLSFEFDVVLDGRELDRPVNYYLVRIKPPTGVAIDPTRRPFIVFEHRRGDAGFT